MVVCDEENLTGNCQTYTDVESKIPFHVKSLEVKAGKFKVYYGKNFYGTMAMLTYPFKADKITHEDAQLKFAPLSLVADIDDSFCYENRGQEYTPSRFYNVTASGAACKNWKETKFAKFGDHSYCGNPDAKTKVEPWCFTHDPEKPWEYCSVPKCVWDFECYTGNGYEYRGTISRTENGYNCQNWLSDFPHPHGYHHGAGIGDHNYGRNPGNNEKAPWCFTTNLFKRWDYIAPPKCDRKKHPFYRA